MKNCINWVRIENIHQCQTQLYLFLLRCEWGAEVWNDVPEFKSQSQHRQCLGTWYLSLGNPGIRQSPQCHLLSRITPVWLPPDTSDLCLDVLISETMTHVNDILVAGVKAWVEHCRWLLSGQEHTCLWSPAPTSDSMTGVLEHDTRVASLNGRSSATLLSTEKFKILTSYYPPPASA